MAVLQVKFKECYDFIKLKLSSNEIIEFIQYVRDKLTHSDKSENHKSRVQKSKILKQDNQKSKDSTTILKHNVQESENHKSKDSTTILKTDSRRSKDSTTNQKSENYKSDVQEFKNQTTKQKPENYKSDVQESKDSTTILKTDSRRSKDSTTNQKSENYKSDVQEFKNQTTKQKLNVREPKGLKQDIQESEDSTTILKPDVQKPEKSDIQESKDPTTNQEPKDLTINQKTDDDDEIINEIIKEKFGHKPYKHQLKQLKLMLNNSEYFFNACCGSGKTLVELGYVIIRNYKTTWNKFYTGESILIVVPRISLLEQHREKLNLPAYYTDEKSLSDKMFCVSNSLENINRNFDTLILDEAHHDYTGFFKSQVKKIPKFTKCFYFSATFNIPRILEEHKQIYEFTHFEAVEQKIVTPFKVWYYVVKNRKDQKEILTSINNILIEKPKCIKPFNKILIMCNSVKDTQTGSLGVNSVYNSIISVIQESEIYKITADTKSIDRHEILTKFESSPDRNIIVNCNCISEGTDLKSVDTVIFKDDRFSEVGLVQSAGRVVRLHKNKQTGNLIFFVEDTQEYIDNFRKEILSVLCSYDQTILENSEVINRSHEFKFVNNLFKNDDTLKRMINDKITTLNFRFKVLSDFIKKERFPDSNVLPYITKDICFKFEDFTKIDNKVFKITNTLNDIIAPFRTKTFGDIKIKNYLSERYNEDLKIVENEKLRTMFVKQLIKNYMNNIKEKSFNETFPDGKDNFIFNGHKHENKNFDKTIININLNPEVFKMFCNVRQLDKNMTYYFKVGNNYFKY